MRKKGFKGRCEKRQIEKCAEICKTYDAVQYAYADILAACLDITEIQCNVVLDSVKNGAYTSDFVCRKQNGDLLVRECVFRRLITKPMTVRLLEVSRQYWLRHGVSDWGIAIDAEV